MRVTCTNCGGAHTPWDCKRPAKKSTAALTEVHSAPRDAIGRAAMSQTGPAGLKALPVDTNSPEMVSEQPQAHGSSPCMDQGKIGGQQPTVQLVTAGETASTQKRPRGRPKSITDMKTYKAAKQREYRAKWKGRE